MEVLTKLVATEILITIAIFAQVYSTCLCLIEEFPDPIYKKGFDIYDPVAIYNFPKICAKQLYMSRILEY